MSHRPKRKPIGSRAWTPLQRAEWEADSVKNVLFDPQMTEEEKLILLRDEIYFNSRYRVNLRRHHTSGQDGEPGPTLIHLSIRTLDKRPARDWGDFQRIKNELVGPEVEMVELYPAESRLVDTVNQYHLWGYDRPGFQFPFGWLYRPPNDNQRPLEGGE